jgi:hypothetical protein
MDLKCDHCKTGHPFCRIRISHGKTAACLHGTTGGTRTPEPVRLDYTAAPKGSLSPSRWSPAGGNTGHPHNIADFNDSTNAVQRFGGGLTRLHRDRRCIKPRRRRGDPRQTLVCAAHCFPPTMATGHIQRAHLLRQPEGLNHKF